MQTHMLSHKGTLRHVSMRVIPSFAAYGQWHALNLIQFRKNWC